MTVTLALPRDEISIPVVRRICGWSLRVLGITDDCIHDLEVALGEACANVLEHAHNHADKDADDGDQYAVSAGVEGRLAVIDVVDTGAGFDPAAFGRADADPGAEQGRGIQLMRALVDKVSFSSVSGAGTRVHLEKTLQWEDDAPIARLSTQNARSRRWVNDHLLAEARRLGVPRRLPS